MTFVVYLIIDCTSLRIYRLPFPKKTPLNAIFRNVEQSPSIKLPQSLDVSKPNSTLHCHLTRSLLFN